MERILTFDLILPQNSDVLRSWHGTDTSTSPFWKTKSDPLWPTEMKFSHRKKEIRTSTFCVTLPLTSSSQSFVVWTLSSLWTFLLIVGDCVLPYFVGYTPRIKSVHEVHTSTSQKECKYNTYTALFHTPHLLWLRFPLRLMFEPETSISLYLRLKPRRWMKHFNSFNEFDESKLKEL